MSRPLPSRSFHSREPLHRRNGKIRAREVRVLSEAKQFLCDDHKVRVKLRFKGRQKLHKENGFQIMNRFVQEVARYGRADSPPKMLGDRDLNVLQSPLPRNPRPAPTDPLAAAPPASGEPVAPPAAPLPDEPPALAPSPAGTE